MKNLEDRRPLWERAGMEYGRWMALTFRERMRIQRRLSGISRVRWFLNDCRWFVEDRLPRRRRWDGLLAAYRRERADRWAMEDRFGRVDFGDGKAFR